MKGRGDCNEIHRGPGLLRGLAVAAVAAPLSRRRQSLLSVLLSLEIPCHAILAGLQARFVLAHPLDVRISNGVFDFLRTCRSLDLASKMPSSPCVSSSSFLSLTAIGEKEHFVPNHLRLLWQAPREPRVRAMPRTACPLNSYKFCEDLLPRSQLSMPGRGKDSSAEPVAHIARTHK